jgi:hypothetical protein
MSTDESIAIPCSVKASGLGRRGCREGLHFGIAGRLDLIPRQFKKERGGQFGGRIGHCG